ncbi:MAG TPA: hypothetical protein PK876_01675 [Elusimicrobiota bacterium]|nr:hypothetical protein [Elusimicrobiota bacterium]
MPRVNPVVPLSGRGASRLSSLWPMMKTRLFKNKILFYLCLLTVCGYAWAGHYVYSITDRDYVIDHDYMILSSARIYSDYDQRAPGRYLRESVQDILFHRGDRWYTKNLQTLILAGCFMLFGKTLIVYKMSMIWALLGLVLAAYLLLYRETRSELAGLWGALLLLTMTNTITMSRRYFGFLPMACVALWALYAYLRYQEEGGRRWFALLCALFVVGTWIHYSVYLYFMMFAVVGLFVWKERRFLAVYSIFYLSVLLWNKDQLLWWLSRFQKRIGPILGSAAPNGPVTDLISSGLVFLRKHPGPGLADFHHGLKAEYGEALFYMSGFLLIVYGLRCFIGNRKNPEPVAATIRTMRFLGAIMVSLIVIMRLIGVVKTESYVVLYSAGALLYVLMAWGLTRSPSVWFRNVGWACLFIVVPLQLVRAGGVWRFGVPSEIKGSDGLGQFFHYVRQTEDGGGAKEIGSLRTGLVLNNQQQLVYQKDFSDVYMMSCFVDAQSFYEDVRFRPYHFDALTTKAKTSPEEVSPDDRAVAVLDGYRYLFVLVKHMEGVERSMKFDHVYVEDQMRSLADSKFLKKVMEMYQYLVDYQMDPGTRLFVFRSRGEASLGHIED